MPRVKVEHICKMCGKSFVSTYMESKYCSRECYAKARAAKVIPPTVRQPKPKQDKAAAEATAKAGASDNRSKPLVDTKWCNRCEYGTGDAYAKRNSCNYMNIMGHSRTSLHPEGLTSTCYEFKPRKRRGRRKQGIVIT